MNSGKLSRKRKKERNMDFKKKNDANEIREHRLLIEPVLAGLKQCPKGQEMNLLISILQPSNLEILASVSSVKADLHHILPCKGYIYRIFDFGSTVSGLAFRDSDFDFYINYESTTSEQDPQTMQGKFIHMAESKMQYQRTFKDCVKIPFAKVPLLTAVHVKTNITCDLNFSNSRGCYNSKFIYLALRFDPRIHNLGVIVKCWAKCSNMLGKHRQMNTYSLIMMIICYLQQLDKPLLPSVMSMLKYSVPVRFGVWDLGIPERINFQKNNKQTLRELLTGFMQFYSEFKWDEYVISPYLGKVCTRKDFELKNVPELQRYYDAVDNNNYPEYNLKSFICIQDPFELNLNCGSICMSPAHFKQIQASLKYSSDLLQNLQEDTFANLLFKLFTDCQVVENSAKKNKSKFISNIKANDKIKICKLNPLEYELFLTKQIMLIKIVDKKTVISEADIKKFWTECVVDFLEDILVKIFFVKLEEIKNNEPKTQKKEDESQIIKCFQMKADVNVYTARKKIHFTNELELNQEISNSKLRAESKLKANLDCLMNFVVDKEKTCEVRFSDNLTGKDSSITSFFKDCFLVNIRNCLKGYFMILLKRAEDKINQA